MFSGRRGYIFFETVVAMGLLSVSALVIQGALRQAVITRGQAQDYTTARFLLEKMAAEHALRFQQPEGSGAGRFEPPYERFEYRWQLERVDVPVRNTPLAFMQPPVPIEVLEAVERVEEMLQDYMGKLTIRISWSRAGMSFDAVGETLLRPELLWLPDPEFELDPEELP